MEIESALLREGFVKVRNDAKTTVSRKQGLKLVAVVKWRTVSGVVFFYSLLLLRRWGFPISWALVPCLQSLQISKMLNVTIINFKRSHSEQYFRVDKHVSSVLFQLISKTFI